MSQRIDPTWRVIASPTTVDGLRCVDLFSRPDGTFGFERFRRDPEDLGDWTPLGNDSALVFADLDAAREAARRVAPEVFDATSL
jgi:hypothetical protein